MSRRTWGNQQFPSIDLLAMKELSNTRLVPGKVQDLQKSLQSRGSMWKGLFSQDTKPGKVLPSLRPRAASTQAQKGESVSVFHVVGTVVLQKGKRRRTRYSGRSQREQRALGRLPELAPYWLHPQLFEEKLGLSKLSASLLRLCIL